MMTKSLEELIASMKAAAEKATPGPWRRASMRFNCITHGPFSFAKEDLLGQFSEKCNSDFVAECDPPNVLALIAALEQAQQYAKQRDEENQDLMLTIGRLRVEREQLEAIKLITFPENKGPSHGWIIDPAFTERVQALAGERFGYEAGLEETEATLLSFAEIERIDRAAASTVEGSD